MQESRSLLHNVATLHTVGAPFGFLIDLKILSGILLCGAVFLTFSIRLSIVDSARQFTALAGRQIFRNFEGNGREKIRA